MIRPGIERMEKISEFKYLGIVLGKHGSIEGQMRKSRCHGES